MLPLRNNVVLRKKMSLKYRLEHFFFSNGINVNTYKFRFNFNTKNTLEKTIYAIKNRV